MLKKIKRAIKRVLFPGSANYWESRYAAGGNSGGGSYGALAEFKARVINEFVKEHEIADLIEFGCGDGNQLTLAEYPSYLGVDVSQTAVELCRERFAGDDTKRFQTTEEYQGEQVDVSMSLDVIYHLVEQGVYERYMKDLFAAAKRYVIIYAFESIPDGSGTEPHLRCWEFTSWIRENAPDWKLLKRIPNEHPFEGDFDTGSFADFFIYEKAS